MANMNVFSGDAFSMTSMTSAFERIDYRPQLLGSLNLFRAEPSRTRAVSVERRNGFIRLVPTTPVGAPPTELENDKRDIRLFNTVRLAKSATMYAEEVQNVRAFGDETELTQVQAEVLRRGQRIVEDMELTKEHMRLGAIQGVVVDADGNTVINNWYTEFGISPPAPVDFALDDTTTKVRIKCHEVIRSMERSAKGAMGPGTTVHALAGDEFFDKFITHPEVEKTYLNWAAASDLRENLAFRAFTFGGITWHNYRGTDDNSTVAVDPETAHFFPVGGADVFSVAYAPAEFGPFVNTPGRESYAMVIPDREREAWVKIEQYSYPLFICSRPEVLRTGLVTTAT